MNKLSFQPVTVEGSSMTRFLACVDDTPLASLVHAFDEAQGFDPPGGYGGLPRLPRTVSHSLTRESLAQSDPVFQKASNGDTVFLECMCGTEGCWPFYGSIGVSDAAVTWYDFWQPRRPERDYSGFGPFAFDIDQYLKAVRSMMATGNGGATP